MGDEFPKEVEKKSARNELICASASHRLKIPWPLSRGSAVMIAMRAEDNAGHTISYESNEAPLEKNITLHFRALTAAKRPYIIKWQITNTGEEAQKAKTTSSISDDKPILLAELLPRIALPHCWLVCVPCGPEKVGRQRFDVFCMRTVSGANRPESEKERKKPSR